MNDRATAYEQLQKEALQGRELEAAALMKAAQRLKSCVERWKDPTGPGREDLAEALRYNQRLWTLLQVDLSRSDHDLPEEIRRSLLQLSDYVDRCTLRLLADPVKSRLDSLIQINWQIAEGLRTKARDIRESPVRPQFQCAEPAAAEAASQLDVNF